MAVAMGRHSVQFVSLYMMRKAPKGAGLVLQFMFVVQRF